MPKPFAFNPHDGRGYQQLWFQFGSGSMGFISFARRASCFLDHEIRTLLSSYLHSTVKLS
jgi:hypothetical protein